MIKMQKFSNRHTEISQKSIVENNDYKSVEDIVVDEMDPITSLMEIMRTVKTTGKEAKLNATTISDGEGGRIKF